MHVIILLSNGLHAQKNPKSHDIIITDGEFYQWNLSILKSRKENPTSMHVGTSPEAACPHDRHVRQERSASGKPAAVAGRDDIVEGARKQHGRRPTDTPRPGAAPMRRRSM